MLEKHLLAKTQPIAVAENIVRFGDYRVSVLFDRLFRIEKNRSGAFHDAATQSVWYRNMPAVRFDVKEASSYVEIKTESVTLHLAKSIAKSYVLINGKKVPLNNEGNLLGTTRTLDMYDGDVCIEKDAYTKLELGTGVCSRSGVAVFDDTESLRLMDDGRLCEKSSDELDIYPFKHQTPKRIKALLGHKRIAKFGKSNLCVEIFAL